MTSTTTLNRMVFALTSHDKLGETGRSTGAYLPEIAHPAKVFSNAGWTIDFVSVAGGRPPLDGIKADDLVSQDFMATPAVVAKMSNTKTADQLDPREYQVIYFAGGHGTMWDFPDCGELADFAAGVYAAGGVVAAVCHGPAGLLGIRQPDGTPLVAGRTVTSFTNDEETAVGLHQVVPFLLETALVDLGAIHRKAANFAVFAVADERLVTGQNPASAAKVAELAMALVS